MVFNATFNNISVIPWRSVLLVEETELPRENHRSVASSLINKGNNKITEHRAIFQRKRQNSHVNKQTKSVNNRKTGKTAMILTWYRHFHILILNMLGISVKLFCPKNKELCTSDSTFLAISNITTRIHIHGSVWSF